MKKTLVIFYFILFAGNLFCQNIEVEYLTDLHKKNTDVNGFVYIDSKFNLSEATKIADYKLTMDKTGSFSILPTFESLRADANKNGANAFVIKSAEFTGSKYEVNVETYFFDEEMKQMNNNLYEKDRVIVFGNLQTNVINEATTCIVNKGKTEIMPFRYKEYTNPKGSTIDIRPDGSSGVSVIGGKDKEPLLYYIGYQIPQNKSASLTETFNINLGSGSTKRRIYPLELATGYFIKDIIDKTSKN